jgi:hypothetical protein
MATKANINIDQGTTFNTVIQLTDNSGNPLDLSMYTAQAELRTTYASINSISFNIATSNGQIQLSLDANTTGILTRPRYVYDVVVFDSSNNVTRVLEGVAYVDQRVTRPAYANTYYTLQLANVQQTFYTGDIVYQSNGSANIVATVYESDNYQIQPVYNPDGVGNNNSYANLATIKVMNPSGNLSITANSGYYLYDANTNANAAIVSITQTTTKNQE